MKTRSTTFLMMLAAGALSVCSLGVQAQERASDTGTPSEREGKMHKAGGMNDMVSPADKKFMMQAAQVNIAEISAGQLALKRGSSQKVKDYAQKMITDHTKAQGELKTIAQNAGVTLPNEPAPKDKAVAKKLSRLSGAAFDSTYMKSQHEGHAMAAKKFRAYINNRMKKNEDAVAYANKTLPVVEQHLTMAHGSHKKMASKKM
jgi:putative membrane protein